MADLTSRELMRQLRAEIGIAKTMRVLRAVKIRLKTMDKHIQMSEEQFLILVDEEISKIINPIASKETTPREK